MQFLSTDKISLEKLFNSDLLIPYKYYSKGKFKIKTVPFNTVDKSYIYDCYVIIDAILQHQRLLHDSTRYINLSKKGINKVLSDKRRLVATHLLEHASGIIEVNHKYCFKGGSVSNYTKSFTIATQYRGAHIYISLEDSHRKGGAHLQYCLNTHNINNKGGCTSTYIVNNKKKEGQHPIMHPPLPYSKVSKTTGRIFNEINLMKKEDRQQLKDLNGNPLIEIDFTCSNAQHLVKVIRDDLKSGNYTPEQPEEFIEEVRSFKEQVLNDDLYLLLANKYGIDRESMKTNVLYWLGGHYMNRTIVKWLCTQYPLITQYIAYNNANYSKGTKMIVRKNFVKRVDKKNGMVNRLMQSEAHLVNEVIKANAPTGKICYTVFDAVLVERSIFDDVTKVINKEGSDYLGFVPKFKVKRNPVTVAPVAPAVKEVEPKPMIIDNGFDITSLPTTVSDLDSYFIQVEKNLNEFQLKKEMKKQKEHSSYIAMQYDSEKTFYEKSIFSY